MNILTLDCEYAQPSKRTIEIGAAAFHVKTGELLETFQTYVDPQEEISEYIANLTGITTQDVEGAPNILDAYLQLKEFAKKHKCFKNPLVWGSGASNDSIHIYHEAYPTPELRQDNPNFMGFRVLDVKAVYQSIQVYNNKTVKGGLAKACERTGIGFEGDVHRALNDAINTFRLWRFLIEKFGQGFK